MDHVIFLIEDDKNLNTLFCKSIAARGFTTIPAYSLKEAVEYLENHPAPDVIILDLELPDGNGMDILPHLSSNHFNHTKLVVVSGNTYTLENTSLLNFANHALIKPVTPRALATLITTLVEDQPASP